MHAPAHPSSALFKGEQPFPVIPSCEHYAGELYDRASYRYCWDQLQKARVSGVDIPHEAEKASFQ